MRHRRNPVYGRRAGRLGQEAGEATMVRRTSTVRRRGLTAYNLVELLTGEIMYRSGITTAMATGSETKAATTSRRTTSPM
jgi:hypothetical protein